MRRAQSEAGAAGFGRPWFVLLGAACVLVGVVGCDDPAGSSGAPYADAGVETDLSSQPPLDAGQAADVGEDNDLEVDAGSEDPLLDAGSEDPLLDAGSEDPPPDADSEDPLDTGAPPLDTGSDPDPDQGPPEGPVMYPTGVVHSPITSFVADNLGRIAELGPDLQDDVFMKVGASSTTSTNYLHCFAGDHVDLDGRDGLHASIDYFGGGDAAGTTPFERSTEAARIGRSTGWALSGNPSPLEREIAAIAPRFAVVAYGTNDMQMGITYRSALWGFGDDLTTLVDELIEQGVVPALLNVPPRTDVDDAFLWVPTYNVVVRAVAQSRQIPLFDFHLLASALPGFGLAGDGLHGNVYRDGGARACVFTDEALEYRMNVRNLATLELLDRLRLSVVEGLGGFAEDAVPISAAPGTSDAPVPIPGLPFTDARDTSEADQALLDTNTGCDPDQDESGPEYVYRLELAEQTPIRALVMDQGATDVDLHLLDASGTTDGCIERAHQMIERTLDPGTYYFVLDSFVSRGEARAGPYLFAVLVCDGDDRDCR